MDYGLAGIAGQAVQKSQYVTISTQGQSVAQDGVSSAIARVLNLCCEVDSMARSLRQNIAPTPDKEGNNPPNQGGLLGALQSAEVSLRSAGGNLSFLMEHLNS